MTDTTEASKPQPADQRAELSRHVCSLSDTEMLTFIEKYGWKLQCEDEDGKMWWECCNHSPHGYGEGDTIREAIQSAYAVHLEEGGEPIAANAYSANKEIITTDRIPTTRNE